MPLECPQPGCDGHLDQGACVFCGKSARLADALYRFPTPDKIRQHEDEREDFAIREA